jgi:hypothetical protein
MLEIQRGYNDEDIAKIYALSFSYLHNIDLNNYLSIGSIVKRSYDFTSKEN